jgi:hypothetical protein
VQYSLPELGTEYLGKLYAVFTTYWLGEFGYTPSLLAGPIFVVVLALLGVSCGVYIPTFLAERIVPHCHDFLGLLGNTRVGRF